MGFLHSYGKFLLRHPGKILLGGVLVVVLLFIATVLTRTSPSFKEPLVGFEARNTPLSARINTWNILIDETSALANNLVQVPSLVDGSEAYRGSSKYDHIINDPLNLDSTGLFPDPPIIEESTQHIRYNTTNLDTFDEDEEDYYRSINATIEEQTSLIHYSLGSRKAFCGKVFEGYAQFVVSPTARNANIGLFNLNSILSICQLDRRLRLENHFEEKNIFNRDCERYQNAPDGEDKASTACCNSWTLPNFIACLNNKTTCMDLDHHDIKNMENLLNQCAPYYLRTPYEECFSTTAYDDRHEMRTSLDLISSTAKGFGQWPRSICGSIPEKCLTCDGWIHTVMNYLISDNFISNRSSSDLRIKSTFYNRYEKQSQVAPNVKDTMVHKLSYSNIFLPIAKSASLLKYYQTISKLNLKTKFVQIKAMDLGLRNSLFEHMISDDAKLFIVALALIMLIISIYTWSLILSLVILVIICLSICLSYVIYEAVLNVPIFPFMNLLAVVISFGICSDNAMLFCKHWSQDEDLTIIEESSNQSRGHKRAFKEQTNLNRMLSRAILSTFVATLATACSFILSAISKVTAIRCFCIFATLSVITNYLLIVLLLPPALILDYRFSAYSKSLLTDGNTKLSRLLICTERVKTHLLYFGDRLHRDWIFNIVTRFRYYLIITSITFLACAAILVFYRPTLQPSDQEGVQLLSSKHAFEQYDKTIKRQFAFERVKLGESTSSSSFVYEPPDTLPVRIVFGVKPTDNGNHLDPYDRGSLVFDPKFDFSDPNTQIWLRDFCQKLRNQRFIHPTNAPDSTSCFIESFKSWMETRSCKDPISTDIDRSPCCQAYEFPYSRYVFDRCIGQAVNIMRKTPQFQSNLNAGVKFFSNTTQVAALIIEYQSNRLYTDSFSKMDKFFADIDEWITWQINMTAPIGLKSGWFISSDLDLLALQTELNQSTTSSIILEVVFAMMALLLGTRDLVLTLAGSLTIGTIIIITVAILIVLRWTLGVAESILITLTIGLSIDFALHYCIAFSESRSTGSNFGTTHKILSEVGSPIALATLTTSVAGFVIVWSEILAYQQLGIFLILIASTSWMASTFLLLPMLATINSIVERNDMFSRISLTRVLKMLTDRL